MLWSRINIQVYSVLSRYANMSLVYYSNWYRKAGALFSLKNKLKARYWEPEHTQTKMSRVKFNGTVVPAIRNALKLNRYRKINLLQRINQN